MTLLKKVIVRGDATNEAVKAVTNFLKTRHVKKQFPKTVFKVVADKELFGEPWILDKNFKRFDVLCDIRANQRNKNLANSIAYIIEMAS